MPRKVRSLNREQVVKLIKRELDRLPGVRCYVQWRCPKCRDVVQSNEPNQLNTYYIHGVRLNAGADTFCGGEYRGNRFRLYVEMPPTEGTES